VKVVVGVVHEKRLIRVASRVWGSCFTVRVVLDHFQTWMSFA
jgi:hypothetical protein